MTYEEMNALAIQHQRYDRSIDIFAFGQAMQDAVIEECAMEVESAGGDSTEYHASRIRALKSQQDAAIESKPTYEDGYRDAWSEACPNCGHVKGEQLDSGEAK
jgi:hypothetical protein